MAIIMWQKKDGTNWGKVVIRSPSKLVSFKRGLKLGGATNIKVFRNKK